MNKIDPVLILLFFVVTFVSAIFVFDQSKTELQQSTIQYNEFLSNSSKYISLKQSWGKDKNRLKQINKMLKYSGINNVDRKILKNQVILQINNIDIKKIDKFINKILNANIKIEKMSLNRSKFSVSIRY
jgi:hypothetical protein